MIRRSEKSRPSDEVDDRAGRSRWARRAACLVKPVDIMTKSFFSTLTNDFFHLAFFDRLIMAMSDVSSLINWLHCTSFRSEVAEMLTKKGSANALVANTVVSSRRITLPKGVWEKNLLNHPDVPRHPSRLTRHWFEYTRNATYKRGRFFSQAVTNVKPRDSLFFWTSWLTDGK